MIVRLPFPDPSLFPNRRTGKHWTVAHAAKKVAREAGYMLTKQAIAAQGAPIMEAGYIPLSLVFITRTERRTDLDNMLAACKPMLDGVALALGIDDSRFAPIVLDRGGLAKPGAVVVGIGVQAA